MINWEQVKQLEADIGAEDFEEVVTLFLAEVDEAVAQLKSSPPDNSDDVASALHFLKGSAYNLGFQAFGDYCSEGELQALNSSLEGIELAKVADLYVRSKKVFLSEMSDHISFDAGHGANMDSTRAINSRGFSA